MVTKLDRLARSLADARLLMNAITASSIFSPLGLAAGPTAVGADGAVEGDERCLVAVL